MSLPAFVATPGISIGYLQDRTKLDNLMLAQVHERRFQAQVGISKSFGRDALHGIKGRDECRAAIWIDEVVAGMDTDGDHLSLLGDGHRIGD